MSVRIHQPGVAPRLTSVWLRSLAGLALPADWVAGPPIPPELSGARARQEGGCRALRLFLLQVHQPSRLRRYSIFDVDRNYFDSFGNAEICRKLAQKCYNPRQPLMLDLIRRHNGRFRIAYSLSGIVMDQSSDTPPTCWRSFQELADTGCVEFLSETYYHSLSFLYSREEFAEQVRLHGERIWQLFRQKPSVFRNTELIYNNDLAHFVAGLGYKGILCEGALAHCSPNHVYRTPGTAGMTLLLRNPQLSDDISFRFCNHAWPEWPSPPTSSPTGSPRSRAAGTWPTCS